MNVAGRLAFAAQGAFFLEVMELKDVIVVFPVKETALSLRALIEKTAFMFPAFARSAHRRLMRRSTQHRGLWCALS